MAFRDKNSDETQEVESVDKSHSLAEAAIDAGAIDVAPATASVAIVPEQPLPTVETGPIETRRSNYTRRDSLRGEAFDQPEPAAMLTADRLLDVSPRNRPAPEGFWRRLVYFVSLKMINPGDSNKVRERKAVDARISTHFDGGAKFVPVLTRKGGVGKTTVTTLLGMALALVREDRVARLPSASAVARDSPFATSSTKLPRSMASPSFRPWFRAMRPASTCSPPTATQCFQKPSLKVTTTWLPTWLPVTTASC